MVENTAPLPVETLASVARTARTVKESLSSLIVGQDRVVEELLVSVICGGHVLLEGVPGLAKTTMISVLAKAVDLGHNRVQFTPDLMPGDILGAEILEENKATGERSFRFRKGPIFTQVLLADEINRTPPKTQAALLQAMQEKKVSYAGFTHELPFPFLVFATQNPIENEGTYPLPEAQLDRFMFKICVPYPDQEEERKIALLNPGKLPELSVKKTTAIPWRDWQELLDRMPLADSLIASAVRLARFSRPEGGEADDFIRKYVRWGAGPRASQYLLLASRGLAAIEGLAAPTQHHLKRVAYPVLRHRIIPSFSAESGRVSVEDIISHLLESRL